MIDELLDQLKSIKIEPAKKATPEEIRQAQEISKKVNEYFKNGDLASAKKYLTHLKNEYSRTNQ